MSRRRDHPGAEDRGSILVMTLLVIVVFGALAGSIAAYGSVSFVHTRTVRTQTAMRVSAEAGLRATLDQMRRHQSLCADSAPTALGISPNGASVTVTCTGVSGQAQGANGWAVILTGVGANQSFPSLQSEGGGTRQIGGSLYMGVPSSNDVTNLTVKDGDLWYPSSNCATATPPTVSGMTITPTPPRGKICTSTTWPLLVPSIVLPDVPTTLNPSGQDNLVPGCRVFFPGKYTAPPALASQNYFASGDYYFEFNGSWQIKQSVVIGGRVDPALGDTQYLSAPSCASAPTDPAVLSAPSTNGYGVTWIMGTGATIDISNQGKVELFRRRQGSQSISLITVPTTAAGYVASTVTLPGGTALIGTKSGSNNDMVIHGLIDAPLAQIAFGNVSGSANAQVLGGVVAAGIDMQSSASASGFVVETSSIPANARILMTSKATAPTGGSATVQAVIDFQPSRIVVDGVTTNTSKQVTSATAAFSSADVGNRVSGAGIVGDTTIASVTNATTATLSAPATQSGSGVTLVIQTPQIAINSWRKL
jgi:hypothetical protein